MRWSQSFGALVGLTSWPLVGLRYANPQQDSGPGVAKSSADPLAPLGTNAARQPHEKAGNGP